MGWPVTWALGQQEGIKGEASPLPSSFSSPSYSLPHLRGTQREASPSVAHIPGQDQPSSKMQSLGLLAFSLLPLLFFTHPAGALVPTKNYTREVGSFINLDASVSKGTRISSIQLRSASLRKGLALWAPGKPLTVTAPQYSGRITFLEENSKFRIDNLRVADGGVYEILAQQTGGSEQVLRKYMVFVFNISVTASWLPNGSCSVDLRCEAGTGSRGVTYTWKRTAMGATLSRDSWLHLLMGRNNEEDSYTCTAQDLGMQGALDVKPYKHCGDPSRAEGRFGFGLLPSGLLALLLSLLVLL